jgi:hypothetical protein
MKSFKEWVNQPQKQKLWRANKEEILDFWKTLDPNAPLLARPIPYDHKGTTYSEDGVRITGSKEFINSIIARLKDLVSYEGNNTKLSPVYRQTEKKNFANTNPTFVFYVQVRERGKKKK